jgi:hypothetical protein
MIPLAGMSECGHESSLMRRPWPTGGLLHHDNKKKKLSSKDDNRVH